jgi:membrane associated rhomboid family serine protease
MIPLHDDIPSRTTPIVNYAIIALCALAFLAQLSSADRGTRMTEQYGFVPLRLSDPAARPIIEQQFSVPTPRGVVIQSRRYELAEPAIPPWLTLITCMFLHGGWMHILGNLWFLYVFGDNVEDRLGHVGFALVYLGTGILAGLAHYLAGPQSPIPTIGASGAIAGVMGAYLILYPHARVLAVLPLFVIFPTFVLPAPIFLGIWFVMQAISGISTAASGAVTGVAWWAHIGGFAAGALIAFGLSHSPLDHQPVARRRF